MIVLYFCFLLGYHNIAFLQSFDLFFTIFKKHFYVNCEITCNIFVVDTPKVCHSRTYDVWPWPFSIPFMFSHYAFYGVLVPSTESRMAGFSFASIHTRLNSDLFGHLNIYPTPWSSGHPHVAGSEQQGAHHRCLPARHFLFLLPEACEWHEHCQRLPSLLSSLQTRLQELLHPRWHHLHQGHRWPYRPLRCQILLLHHAPLSSL